MIHIIYKALYVFFMVLEIILFFYIIISWFPIGNRIRNKVTVIVSPILEPTRFLLKHSIFNTNVADLSPIISLIIILYLQQFFYYLT
jgi:YggT family protein